MTSEKTTKDMGKLKQKMMIGATVFVVLIIIWQGIKLMGGGSSAPTPAATPGSRPQMTAAHNSMRPSGNNMTAMSVLPNQASPGMPIVQQPVSEQPKQAPVQGNSALLKLQQETQAKYIAALNELQMLKLQQEIAATKQAITTATLATATAEKNITDLLTVQQAAPTNSFGMMPSAPQMPSTPASIPPLKSAMTETGTPKMPARPVSTAEAPYSLLSVSFEANRWTAVIGYETKMFNVSVGDSLPPDESIVTAIGRDGVVIRKDKETRKLVMTPSL